MFTTAELLCGILLPLALAMVAGEVLRDCRSTSPRWAVGATGLAVVLAVLISHGAVAVAGNARLAPPILGWHWLLWAGLGLLLTSVLAWLPRWWGLALLVLVAAAGAALILRPMQHSLGVTGIAAWAAAAASFAAMISWADTRLGQRNTPITDHLLVLAATGAVALGTGLTGSKDLALLAGLVPLAVCGSGVIHTIFRLPSQRLAPMAGTLSLWHLAVAGTYSEMPWWTALLLAMPLPAALLAMSLFSGSEGRRRWAGLATVGLLALIAVVLAGTLAQPKRSGASDGPGYGY